MAGSLVTPKPSARHVYRSSLCQETILSPPSLPLSSSYFHLTNTSVAVVSPNNSVLMVKRTLQASAFPSAHVFPGGLLSSIQDGNIPEIDDQERHQDGEAYRCAAIRETFEECGILLTSGSAVSRGQHFASEWNPSHTASTRSITEEEWEKARRDVHGDKRRFREVCKGWDVIVDSAALIPFTRWITPIDAKTRFTTQMYLYFMPLNEEHDRTELDAISRSGRKPINLQPMHDGGIEVTSAVFRQADEYLEQAASGDIVLLPPQMVLLKMMAQFLKPPGATPWSPRVLLDQRAQLLSFISQKEQRGGSETPLSERCICPRLHLSEPGSFRPGVGADEVVLLLDDPGPEVRAQNTDQTGLSDWVAIAKTTDGKAAKFRVARRVDIFGQVECAQKNNIEITKPKL